MGLDIAEGYRLGAAKVREILEWCDEIGVKHVTLFAFSTENFSRPPEQVRAVLSVIREEIDRLRSELDDLRRRGVRVRFIGRLDLLPEDLKEATRRLESATRDFGERTVNVALAYGGRAEIIDAVREIARRVKAGELSPDEIDEGTFKKFLYLPDVPDPDLIIRTSGEERISNFLLWHSAYSEFYFMEAYLPALRKVDFLRAIRDFQRRQRRYGK
ncbi:MAG: polyprenyl diphosphate synthase [Candidatus Korarchaeota archaeon]|nr:polyprenyl diphosphate synthase [Candidatus Korarchaeota archaeon]